MPNTPVQVAGEAMPKINRRFFLGAAAVAGIPAVAVALPIAVSPSADARRLAPEKRIEFAMAEIEAAMLEMYPGWEIQRESRAIRPIRYSDRAELAPVRHGVFILATANEYGPEKGTWLANPVRTAR